jgi:hypothetical protein
VPVPYVEAPTRPQVLFPELSNPTTQPSVIQPPVVPMPQPPAIPLQIIGPGSASSQVAPNRSSLVSPIDSVPTNLVPVSSAQALILPVPDLAIPVGDAGDRPGLQVSPEQLPWANPGIDSQALTSR